MHHLFSLLQTLLLLTLVIRVLMMVKRSSMSVSYYPQGMRRVQMIKLHPCIHAFRVSSEILRDSLYTSSEKRMFVILAFLMAVVQVLLLFPLEVLGVPDPLVMWVARYTYAPLRGKFGDIEDSDRVMALFHQNEEEENEEVHYQ